jgi:2-polyprenyl-6-methoxyphenol hydroxylase-like FAD-dependent oxidoreductase
MEIFNTVGIADQIPQVEAGFKLRRVKVQSMAGEWEEEPMPWQPAKDGDSATEEKSPLYTPFMGAALAQDRLEPIVADKARDLGADIRTGSRMTNFEQSDDSVVVTVACDGQQYRIRADYLIAVDGHRSNIREALRITTTGRGYLSTVRSVLFRASLDEYKKGYQQFVVRQPGLEAFLTTYGDDRWVLMFTDDVERTEEEQTNAIRQAVGLPDLAFEIITTGRWELKANIADTLQVGRVFIAGDAAHTLPPTRGGYGANTGIHDAHNLAWKLAAVVNGSCWSEILDTYSKERQPVAWLRHQQTFARPDYAQYRKPSDDETDIYDDSAIELGQIYVSNIIFDDEEHNALEPLARPPDQWRGRPGTRAPYMMLKTSNGEQQSSLDLFGREWVLITEDERWQDAVAKESGHFKLKIRCIVVNGNSDYADDGSFCDALGLDKGGATLVRPDGYIAWRSKAWPANDESSLRSYITTIAAT